MATKILIIDHNDSFTYNLVGLFERVSDLVGQIDVWPVAALEDDSGFKVRSRGYDGVLLSPGPGLPKDYPAVGKLLQQLLQMPAVAPVPVLGICLGLQTLVTHFGGRLFNLEEIQHGRQVSIDVLPADKKPGAGLFQAIIPPLKAGLYHSWGVDSREKVQDIDILATTTLPETSGTKRTKQLVMAIRHLHLPAYGLQFHPESYMTPIGEQVVRNWLRIISK